MTITVMLVTTVAIHVLGTVGLWLRLRFSAEQQRGHRRYMIAIARALPVGSRVDDRHGDGRRTQLTIGAAEGDS
ncbi:hypothetical protein [Nocardia wallacei]|uniref:hypothetical protein n=1 Tax=Nocardia wallacei TaxID=480035 RepID=UPI002458F5B1|nr:hypothetical protein [Nocardia wallacei]